MARASTETLAAHTAYIWRAGGGTRGSKPMSDETATARQLFDRLKVEGWKLVQQWEADKEPETNHLEFKRKTDRKTATIANVDKDQIARTLSAFANTGRRPSRLRSRRWRSGDRQTFDRVEGIEELEELEAFGSAVRAGPFHVYGPANRGSRRLAGSSAELESRRSRDPYSRKPRRPAPSREGVEQGQGPLLHAHGGWRAAHAASAARRDVCVHREAAPQALGQAPRGGSRVMLCWFSGW